MTIRAPMQHKQPQTLKEAINLDQQRREAAYQEYLAANQRFHEKHGKNIMFVATVKNKYK